MDKSALENIIQEFQNLTSESEKEVFLQEQRAIILAQNKEETLTGLQNLKDKLRTIRLELENARFKEA